MENCLWDFLWAWAFNHHPDLLHDEETFRSLHDFVHLLLLKERRAEAARAFERLVKVSQCKKN